MKRKLPTDAEMLKLLRTKQKEHMVEAQRARMCFSAPGRIQAEIELNHTMLARIYGKMAASLAAEIGE